MTALLLLLVSCGREIVETTANPEFVSETDRICALDDECTLVTNGCPTLTEDVIAINRAELQRYRDRVSEKCTIRLAYLREPRPLEAECIDAVCEVTRATGPFAPNDPRD